MMNRTVTGLFCFLALFVMSSPTYAEPNLWEWQGQAFRLTCLPGQNFAILEPFYLDTMPKTDIEAYKAKLAQQGIYFGTSMSPKMEQLPLTAQCRVGKHTVTANFTYFASVDLAIDNDPSNTLAGYKSLQHCQNTNNLNLVSLKVDDKSWLEAPRFAHTCLDNQVHRLRIYPEAKIIQVCKQSIGGQIEDAPLSLWYSTLSLDENGNEPMPKVTCENINKFPATIH